jgi:hypothetical protein
MVEKIRSMVMKQLLIILIIELVLEMLLLLKMNR